MSCSFVDSDAAYVLGALSPAERLAYERHLDTCADCTRSVRQLAGLPGLLARVDPAVLEEPGDTVPVPDAVLTNLVGEVRRSQRRRRLRHRRAGRRGHPGHRRADLLRSCAARTRSDRPPRSLLSRPWR